MFIGNTDKTTINYNWFSSVLETRYVRFRPMIVTGNHVCLRMEYYGAGRNSGTHFIDLKDKSGIDKIIIKNQPYQLLSTNHEFFPSFHASNLHKLVNESL